MPTPSWIEKLQQRWKVNSLWQVLLILGVFAATGFTVLAIKRFVMAQLPAEGPGRTWGTVIYYILLLPIYNLVLLGYGTIVGQYSFFWTFEKRMFQRLLGRRREN